LADQDSYYSIFLKAKKNKGQFREIIAPNEDYKKLQRKICSVVNGKLPNHELSYAWTEGKDRYKCLIPHIGKDWVMESDVKSFFPNIRTFHIKKIVDEFDTNVDKNLLINLLTLRDKSGARFLPQGFATSPIFANAVRYDMDVLMFDYIQDKDISLSFYGDNIISSSDDAEQLVEMRGFISKIYNDEGFNVDKQPIKPHYYNQEVLGFLINEKFNMSHKYYKKLLSGVINAINTEDKLVSLSLQGKIALLKLNDNPRDYKYITNFITKNGGVLEKVKAN